MYIPLPLLRHSSVYSRESELAQKSEFSIEGLREYNRSSAARWIISHCFEHKVYFFVGLVGFALT